MPKFTDKEAAERLLNWHVREVAAHFDNENLHSAENLMKMPVKRNLELISKCDS